MVGAGFLVLGACCFELASCCSLPFACFFLVGAGFLLLGACCLVLGVLVLVVVLVLVLLLVLVLVLVVVVVAVAVLLRLLWQSRTVCLAGLSTLALPPP